MSDPFDPSYHALKAAMDELVRDGYADKIEDPFDDEQSMYRLTEKGWEHAKELKADRMFRLFRDHRSNGDEPHQTKEDN